VYETVANPIAVMPRGEKKLTFHQEKTNKQRNSNSNNMGSGGKREGAGRKPRGKRAVQYKLSPEIINAVNDSAPPGERSALVDQILRDALGVRPSQKRSRKTSHFTRLIRVSRKSSIHPDDGSGNGFH